mgnify:CR=1 FL=1
MVRYDPLWNQKWRLGVIRHYKQYTAIDDWARPRVSKIYENSNQRIAIQFIDYAFYPGGEGCRIYATFPLVL